MLLSNQNSYSLHMLKRYSLMRSTCHIMTYHDLRPQAKLMA